jgi:hypothetical protein
MVRAGIATIHCPAVNVPIPARSMTSATARGCEINTAWLPLTSTIFEPARFAIDRCASGAAFHFWKNELQFALLVGSCGSGI